VVRIWKKFEEVKIIGKAVETSMREKTLIISPINLSLSLPRLIQLNFRPPNIGEDASLINRIKSKPLQLSHYRPKLIELDILKPDAYKALFISKTSLIILEKPKIKLVKLNVKRPRTMPIPTTIKPLFIQLKLPKLIAINKSINTKI
jgi:hypothetical protein